MRSGALEQLNAVRVFLLTTVGGSIPAAVAVVTEEKLVMHVAINSRHYPITDLFFKYFTHLGDGLVPTAIALFLLWRRTWREFLLVGASAAFSALVAQFLKRGVFGDMLRPSNFLEAMPGIDIVAGVDLHHHFSFPSGHTTAAFSTGLALAAISGRNGVAFALALLACVIGFSRIYLSQHFTVDVVGGALIGTVSALVVWWWLCRSAFSERPWLDRRAFRRVQNQ
jgi:membrane-associated phospholipid phosphatase